nr:methyl-accepting chemotaxis protein [Rhizobium sp. ARZ01]
MFDSGEGDAQPLRGVIAKLAGEASRLGVHLVDIAGAIQDTANQSAAHAAHFARLTRSAEAVAAANGEVARTLGETDKLAANARTLIGEQALQLDGSIQAIDQMVTASNEIGSEISAVAGALSDVGKLADAIGTIARQTNLLALNAAIEAARAGDAGKGFAVVAAEVRALSLQTSQTTASIQSTLQELTHRIDRLVAAGEGARLSAEGVRTTAAGVKGSFAEVGGVMAQILDGASALAATTGDVDQQCADLAQTLSTVSSEILKSDKTLQATSGRVNDVVAISERIIQATANAGIETPDSPFIRKVQALAGEISGRLEAAVRSGAIGMDALFDRRYRPIPGTDPVQYLTSNSELMDRVLPDLQEPVLLMDQRVVFCAAVDEGGYLPTHNRKFSEPQRPGDAAWNTANCRNRRIFDDRVGLGAGRSKEPFLVQTYRRDMGGGQFVLMKDISAPITVNGRHWGGLRLAIRV